MADPAAVTCCLLISGVGRLEGVSMRAKTNARVSPMTNRSIETRIYSQLRGHNTSMCGLEARSQSANFLLHNRGSENCFSQPTAHENGRLIPLGPFSGGSESYPFRKHWDCSCRVALSRRV